MRFLDRFIYQGVRDGTYQLVNCLMKQSNALAYLRQLCSLGLDKQIVLPEFLRAVQALIPSEGNVFTGCDDQFDPTYAIFGHVTPELNEITPDMLLKFFNQERKFRFAQWFSQYPISTDAVLPDKKFHSTDCYNLVWRRYDQYHFVQSPVFINGRIIGLLCLFRPRSQKPFTVREQTLCFRLTPYVAHALQIRREENIQYSETGFSGMMIMDPQGAILYLSESAKKLLTLVRYPIVQMGGRNNEDEVTPRLAQLCCNLNAIFEGHGAGPLFWCHINGRGRFLFRAYWLDRQNRDPGGLIGMTIEHQEPLVLKILRSMQHLPLSPTQKEVALLMAQGISYEKIGERLHIKLTTVKDHVGKIFTKLDIRQREELLPKLLALGNSVYIP